MEDIKVGEYVRLARNQGINKIIDEDDDGFLILDEIIADEYGDECFEISLQDVDKEITKHSFNLTDLIEEGDFVNGKRISCLKGDINPSDVDDENDFCYTNYDDEYGIWYGFRENEVKTILTHEQFEANCYKVKGETYDN